MKYNVIMFIVKIYINLYKVEKIYDNIIYIIKII